MPEEWRTRKALRSAVVPVALIVVGACEAEDPAVPLEMGPTGDSAFTSVVAVVGTGLPAVSRAVGRYMFSSFSAEVPDAWARATGGTGLLYFNARGGYYWSGCCWPDWLAGRERDPRLPRLLGGARNAVVVWIGPPAVMDDPIYDWYTDVFLVPEVGKKYALALVRYGVKVNGVEDHEELLLKGSVTEPDELVPVPNNPGGNFTGGTNWDQYESSGHCWDLSQVQGTANPLVLGVETAFDADGAAAVYYDIVTCQGLWASNPGTATDKSPLTPNRLRWFTMPQYNYLVVFEADAGGRPILDRPVARGQFGPDLAQDGKKLLRNGLAPFPKEAISDPAILAKLPGAIAVPEAVTAQFTNLEKLSGKVYKAWFVNAADGSAVPARGRYTVLDADGNVVTQSEGASSFTGGSGLIHRLEIDYKPIQQAGEFTHLVLSIEDSDGATKPGSRQPLWVQTVKLAGEAATPMAEGWFGNFRSGADPYVYQPSGTGKLGVYGLELLQAYLEHLSRPPDGYFYQGWLVPPDGNPVGLGALVYRTGYGQYSTLVDADVETIPGLVTAREIVSAWQIVRASEKGVSFPSFDSYAITLEPKTGVADQAAPTTAFAAPMPAPVVERRSGS